MSPHTIIPVQSQTAVWCWRAEGHWRPWRWPSRCQLPVIPPAGVEPTEGGGVISPQTTISAPVQTAVWYWRAEGSDTVEVAVQ